MILRTGLANTTAGAVRINRFFPLRGGVVAPGELWTDVRTLNGDSACAPMEVTREAFRSSANDLLLTFRQGGERRSLVLGGLKVADFTKWARTTTPGGHNPRWLALERALPGGTLVGHLDGNLRDNEGTDGPRLTVASGQPFTFPAPAGRARAATVLFGDRQVSFHVAGLDPQKHYALGWSWWDFDGNGRVESVAVRGSGQTERVLSAKRPLPRFQGKEQGPGELAALLPPGCYENSSVDLRFSSEVPGVNAVVSEVSLWEVGPDFRLPPDWATGHTLAEEPRPATPLAAGPVLAELEGRDPVGRLVEAGEMYLPADSFYLGVGTPDPFIALETYGQKLALANHARPHLYDFPTICAWYAGVWHTPGGAGPSRKIPLPHQHDRRTRRGAGSPRCGGAAALLALRRAAGARQLPAAESAGLVGRCTLAAVRVLHRSVRDQREIRPRDARARRPGVHLYPARVPLA